MSGVSPGTKPAFSYGDGGGLGVTEISEYGKRGGDAKFSRCTAELFCCNSQCEFGLGETDAFELLKQLLLFSSFVLSMWPGLLHLASRRLRNARRIQAVFTSWSCVTSIC